MAIQKKGKIDFLEKYPDLYESEEGKASHISVPKLNYLSILGEGHRDESDEFETAMQTIYGIAFSLKLYLKRKEVEGFRDYHMPPMQALWRDRNKDKKERKWQVLILQPSAVTEKMVTYSYEVAKMKNQDQVLPTVTLESFKEGPCIQTLHIGPYDTEKATLDFLEEEAAKNRMKLTGNHHEIYLNDTRRTPAHKLKTILRYQVTKK